MRRSGIYRFYYALAFLDLVTILATLSIAYGIHQVYENSFKENDAWIKRQELYEQTTNLIIAANGPGNNVFDSLDVKKERELFNSIKVNLNTKFKIIEKDILEIMNDSAMLVQGIKHIQTSLEEGYKHTDQIFFFIKQRNVAEAGKYMSRMDGKFHNALIEISKLKKYLRDMQKRALLKNHGKASELFKKEVYVGLFVFVIIGFVFFYGKKLKEKIEQTENEVQERNNILSGYEKALDQHTIVVRTDAQGKITYANDKFSDISGFSNEELIGQNHRILNSGHHPREFFTEMWKTISSGHKWRDLIRNKTKSGDIYWVDTSITPIKDGRGKVIEFLSIKSEMTELIETQNLNRKIQKIAHIGAWEINVRTMVPKWTEGTYEIHEVPVSEAIDIERAISFYAESDRERILNNVRKCIEEGRPFDDEFEFITAKQNKIWVRVIGTPEKDRSGQVIKVLGTFQDINEKKKQQLELIHAKEEAEKAEKSKSEFLTTMSHEIRTPLNGMLGMIQLLKESNLSIEQSRMMDTVSKCGDSLLAILNDILDFSKIISGKIDIENVNFNLNKCIEDAVRTLSPNASQNNVTVKVSLLDEQFNWYVGDVTKVRQIVVNYLSNAIKFSKNGQVEIGQEVLSEENNQKILKIYVKDSGIGIPKDSQEKLFEAFVQADQSMTRRFGGTGLGLSICSKLSSVMKGKVYFVSEEGKGTTFFLEIPLSIGQAEKDKQPHLNEQTDNIARVYPHSILLVEDNEINQKIAVAILKKLGYKCDVAVDGIEALKYFEQKGPSYYTLVFMDMQMPELDGISTTQELVKKYGKENIPRIVAITANAFSDDKGNCLKAGMADFITKPLMKKDLKKALVSNHEKSLKKAA